MRKFKFTLIAFMAAMMALSFTACSDDDPEPNPNPDPEVNEDNYHFDLFVTVDKHGGMSSKNPLSSIASTHWPQSRVSSL